MTRYEVKLTEQEELALRQLATQPGFDALLKLLGGESFHAQQEAMECTEPDDKKRLLKLTDAQCTARIVSHLVQKLAAYREIPVPQSEAADELRSIMNVQWERTN
jgi:hypothetical protein